MKLWILFPIIAMLMIGVVAATDSYPTGNFIFRFLGGVINVTQASGNISNFTSYYGNGSGLTGVVAGSVNASNVQNPYWANQTDLITEQNARIGNDSSLQTQITNNLNQEVSDNTTQAGLITTAQSTANSANSLATTANNTANLANATANTALNNAAQANNSASSLNSSKVDSGISCNPGFAYTNSTGHTVTCSAFMRTTGENTTGNYGFSGNVGIGTTSPSAPLNILQTTSSGILFNRSGHDSYSLSLTDSKGLNIFDATDSRSDMFFDGTGNVGIGTTSPSHKLDVSGGDVGIYGASTNSNIYFYDNATSATQQGRILGYTGQLRLLGGSGTNPVVTINDTSVGIGTTSPGQKLDVNGNAYVRGQLTTIGGAGNSTIALNTNAATWTLTNDYSDSNKFKLFYNTGSPTITVQSNGNVGIGTTNPLSKLTVNGNIELTNQSGLYIDRGLDGASIGVMVGEGSLGLSTKIAGTGTNSYYNIINTGSTSLFYVNGAGNVGIGTTNPQAPLEINTSSSQTTTEYISNNGAQLQFVVNNNTYGWIGTKSNHPLYIGTNSVGKVYIDQNGNVGIGTTSPSGKLEVNLTGTTIPALGTVGTGFNLLRADGHTGLSVGYLGSNGDIWMQNQRTDSATAYNIDLQPNGGNVGIGTTSPFAKLDVRSTTAGGEGIISIINSSSGTSYAGDFNANGAGTTNVGGLFRASGASNNYGLLVTQGSVGIGTATPSYPLEVRSDSTGGVPMLMLNSQSTTATTVMPKITFETNNGTATMDSAAILGGKTANDNKGQLRFYVANATQSLNQYMTIMDNGNVGIGTTSPSQKLDVNGNVNISGGNLYVTGKTIYGDTTAPHVTLDNANGAYIGYNTNDIYLTSTDIRFRPSGTQIGTFTTTGLGIGTTNPGAKLVVNGNLGMGDGSFDNSAGWGARLWINASNHESIGMNAGSTLFTIFNYANGRAGIQQPNAISFENSGGTSRLYVNTSSGNVGIGTTSPGQKLEVNGTIATYASDNASQRMCLNVTQSGSVSAYKC